MLHDVMRTCQSYHIQYLILKREGLRIVDQKHLTFINLWYLSDERRAI